MTGLMEGVSRQTYAATFPPERFYCLLDELPWHLVPQYARAALGARQGAPLYLNANCALCRDGSLPEEIAAQGDLLSRFALQGTIAWLRDRSGAMLPFWLGSRLEQVVCGLRPGEPVPDSVPERDRRLLWAAGILRSEPGNNERELRYEEMVRNGALSFREKGYAPLGSLIHPFHVAALRRYYRYQIRSGAIALGDDQCRLRYSAYKEPVARFFHRALAPTLSAVAGEALKPSYVFMASYVAGAELTKHTDRAQCEFSVTLCLDFSPEPALATPWPIRLATPRGEVAVYQALGDGLAYRGTQLPHFREGLGAGQTSTSLFFHYVPAGFEGSLD